MNNVFLHRDYSRPEIQGVLCAEHMDAGAKICEAEKEKGFAQEEDPGYAADKLQAADELRQWSEAAQCSSIACLVGEHHSLL